MKSLHSKQNSLEFRLTPALNNQAYILKPSETIARTYRKRTQLHEQNTVITLPNATSLLTKQQNTREPKKSLGKSQNRSAEKRSNSRMLNERSIQRLKVVYKPNETISHKTKMAKLVNILSFKPNPDLKAMLSQLYEVNAIFQGLLQEWRRMDLHDDFDDLLGKLVSSYTGIIEDVTVKAYGFMEDCLGKYQEQVAQLQAENRGLKAVLLFQSNKFEVQMMEAENRMYQEFEKGQWSTFILTELAKSGYDLEQFIRRSEVYTRAKLEYFSNGDIDRSRGEDKKRFNENV